MQVIVYPFIMSSLIQYATLWIHVTIINIYRIIIIKCP